MAGFKKGQRVEVVATGDKGMIQQVDTHYLRGDDNITDTVVRYVVVLDSGDPKVYYERQLKPVGDND